MLVSNEVRAQQQAAPPATAPKAVAYPAHPPSSHNAPYPIQQAAQSSMYPTLDSDFMGLSIRPQDLPPAMHTFNPAALTVHTQETSIVPVSSQSRISSMVAPVTGADNAGLARSEIKNGLRMVTLCRDQKHKFGLKTKSIDNGVFVCWVADNCPAALAGLRFGDQIVQIDGENCAGMSSDKALKKFAKADSKSCKLVVRDRPFERTITMQKDSSGSVGFLYKNGAITNLIKDSSAARNGLLIDHHVCEVNGQNVVGMKDKDLATVFANCGRSMTITIMPNYIFDHICKKVSKGLFKQMDHNIPEV